MHWRRALGGIAFACPQVVTDRRILLADDQRDILIALELLLKAEGFATLAVVTPEEVLDAVREESFDALLMDLNDSNATTPVPELAKALVDGVFEAFPRQTDDMTVGCRAGQIERNLLRAASV